MKINEVVNLAAKKFSKKNRTFPTNELLELAAAKNDVKGIFESNLPISEFDVIDDATNDIINVLMKHHFTIDEAIDVIDFLLSLR